MQALHEFDTPHALVTDALEFVVFPAAAIKLNQLLDDASADSQDIADVLSLEPVLSARVLRVANSAAYSGAASVDSVSRAVTLLGRDTLREVVVLASTVSAFDALDVEAVSISDFWEHSLNCGAIASAIARRCDRSAVSAAFSAGLMHDIGQLVLFVQDPAAMREVLTAVALSGDELPTDEAERQVLGYDHCEVGAELARAWKLPSGLATCIAQHHAPAKDFDEAKLLTIVQLADVMSAQYEAGVRSGETLREMLIGSDERNAEGDYAGSIPASVWQDAGLDDVEALDAVVADAEDYREAMSALIEP